MSLLDSASLICTPNGYKEGKLYSVIPSDGSGDLSVTRATTATRVNSAGLVELVPYNLLSWSEDFSNSDWSKFNTTITTNSTTAPNGTLTADTLTASGGTALHTCFWPTAQFGANHTISVYAKKNTNNFLQIYTDFVNTDYANFDLNNGVVGSVGSTVVSSSIENVGNGWYRCSFVTGASASKYVNFSIISSATSPRNESNALTTSVFIWGAQLVQGSVAKDYQKTETRLNIPRLDYSNGTCPSILVEPQRTNLLRYSEDFTNGVWGLYSSGTGVNPIVTANTTTAPNGTTTADTIVLNSGAGTTAANQSQIYQTFSITNGDVYTFSFYAKGSVGGEQLMIRQAAGNTYTKITLTNDWARYEVTETATYTGTGFLELLIRRGLNEPINASCTFYAWGAQVEAGSYATSYIPTTSASVTRNADVISKTGISSLIGQTEGTLFVEVDLKSRVNFNYIALNQNSGIANYISIYFLDNAMGLECVSGSSAQAAIQYNNSSTGIFKIAIAYKQNDFVLYVNGNLIGTDTSGSVPTCDVFDLTAYNRANEMGIKASALWKTRLTNAQLATLTTI